MAENPQKGRELDYYSLAQVGVEMAAPIGLGWLGDDYFGWFPWLTVLGVVSGLVLGFTNILMVVNRSNAEDGKVPKAPPPEDRKS